jgi:hypothetical protein
MLIGKGLEIRIGDEEAINVPYSPDSFLLELLEFSGT